MTLSERLARSLGGLERVRTLRDVLLAELPGLRRQLAAAVEADDLDLVRRLAHTLRSDLAPFEQDELAEVARGLEIYARFQRAPRVRDFWARLEPGLDDLTDVLERLGEAGAEEAPAPRAAGPQVTQVEPSQRRRVLLVEDVEILRRLTSQQLTLRGHQVETCPDGESALARVAAGGIDVVLTDMELPGISGLETITRLRAAESPGEHMWVVALTGSGYLRDQCLEVGADMFLPKPTPLDELWAAVEAAPTSSASP